MDNKYSIISFFLMFGLLVGCVEPKEIPITFVFDKPLKKVNRYPAYFKEIAMPYNGICEGESKDVLLKPIDIMRLDVKNAPESTNAWYFSAIGDNTVNFSIPWLELYFKDSIPPSLLFIKDVIEPNVEQFIKKNKDNLFIYSELSNQDEINGIAVFSNPKKLFAAIKNKGCKVGEDGIFVLVNPGLNTVKPPKLKEEEKLPRPEEKFAQRSCGNFKPTSGIEKTLNQIGDQNKPPSRRSRLIDDFIDQNFAANTVVKRIGESNTIVSTIQLRDYLNRLSTLVTLCYIDVKDKKVDEGKIWELVLYEKHKTSF